MHSSLLNGLTSAQLLAFRVIATSIIIVFAGAIMGKKEGGSHQSTLDRLNNQVFIPCLIFFSLNRIPLFLSEALLMCGCAVIYSLSSYPLARWWRGRTSENDISTYVPLLFSSTSTLLLPLSYLLFGSQGLAKATFFHLTNQFLLDTWGMRCVGQPSRFGKFMKSPALHAALLALILKLTIEFEPSLQIRELLWLVEKGIGMMANGAIPILFISYGYSLSSMRLHGAGLWSPVAAIRMLWLPLVAAALILVLRATGYASMEKGYDLLRYLDLRTTESIMLLASALPCVCWFSVDSTPTRRTSTLTISSALLSMVAIALLVYIINRHIF